MANLNYDQFSRRLLALYSQCLSRDGSEAFDTLPSIHQYFNLYRLVDCYIPHGATVLDWGAGSGHFSWFLSSSGRRVEAYAFNNPELFELVDMSCIAFTKALENESVRLPYSDQSLDAVCSVGVLEHVREFGGSEEASLGEIHRILKPGGFFICYHLPNRYSWIEWLARRVGKWSHQYRYDKKQVVSMFDPASWQVLEMGRYGILPRNSFRALLPYTAANSSLIARVIDGLDWCLEKILFGIAQNWFVIARKVG